MRALFVALLTFIACLWWALADTIARDLSPDPAPLVTTIVDDPDIILPADLPPPERVVRSPDEAERDRKRINAWAMKYAHWEAEDLDLEIASLRADYSTFAKEAFDAEVDQALLGNPSTCFGWWDEGAPRGHAELPVRVGAVYDPRWPEQRQFTVILHGEQYDYIAAMLEKIRWLEHRREHVNDGPPAFVSKWNDETKEWEIGVTHGEIDDM